MTDIEMLRLANGICDMIQNDNEILWAVQRMRDYLGKPAKYFLEIGTHQGGSLVMWSQLLADDGTLISITLSDLPSAGSTSNKPVNELVKTIKCITAKKFELIDDDSTKSTTRNKLMHLLSGNKLDGVFVDSRHSAEQMLSEVKLYMPLINSPGFMAFHDIKKLHNTAEAKEKTTGALWQEMKYKYNYEEKRDNHPGRWCGIGIILL